MKYEKLTPLARPLDMGYRSNRNIVILMIFTFLLYSLINIFWNSSYEVANGLQVSLLVFVAWMLGRELDPDTHLTAELTAIFTLIYSIFLFSNTKFELITGLLILVLMRMVTRVVGITFRAPDLLFVLLVGIYAGYTQSWYLLFAVGIAFIYEAVLHKQNPKAFIFSFTALVLSVFFASKNHTEIGIVLAESFVAIWGMIVFFITSVLIYKDIKAVGDVTDEKVTPARMFASRVIYLMIFLYAVLTTQADEIYTHLAIWMPLWIFSFVNLFKKFIDTFAESKNK